MTSWHGCGRSLPPGRASVLVATAALIAAHWSPGTTALFGRAIARTIHYSGLTPRYWLWKHGSNQ